jgi:hypothetical protein
MFSTFWLGTATPELGVFVFGIVVRAAGRPDAKTACGSTLEKKDYRRGSRGAAEGAEAVEARREGWGPSAILVGSTQDDKKIEEERRGHFAD